MKKKFVLLIALLFPAFVQSAPLSSPASLRDTIPLEAIGYVRIPSPWGLLSAPKGSSLAGALAHEQHVQQIQQVEASVYQNVLTKVEAFTHPAMTLVFHHLRSPIEVMVLLPDNVPPPLANVLMSAKLNFTSLDELNAFLNKVAASTPPLMITEEVSADGYGALVIGGQLPIFLHYEVSTQMLTLMGGMMANPALFRQTLTNLVPIKEHPMYALENRVDTSRQGFFQWVNLQKILPLVLGTLPPPVGQELVPELNKWGLLDLRAAALGWGVREGKGRLSVIVDAPRTGYRQFFPGSSNHISLTASGKPGTVMSFSVPILKWLQGFEKVIEKEGASEELQDYWEFKQFLKQQMGFALEDYLQAIGSQFLFFTDEVGEFGAIQVGDKQLFEKILTALVKNGWASHETRHINGKTYHQMILTFSPLMEDLSQLGEEMADLAFLMKLVVKLNDQFFYWVEEDGYLIFAYAPQMLLERQRHLVRVPIQQWLQQQQHQNIQSSLLAFSTTLSQTPRRLYYYGYLQMLNMAANLAGAKIDIFALPTATELNLSKMDGTYGLQLDLNDAGLALEFTFENSPLDFMLDPSVGAMIAIGMLTGMVISELDDSNSVAEPLAMPEENAEAWGEIGPESDTTEAWSEIVPESKAVPENDVEIAWALLRDFQTLAEEYSSVFGGFPTVAEIEEIWGVTTDENIDIRLLDAKDGYSAEFQNPEISGKLIMRYDADSMTWTCTHEGLLEEELPEECWLPKK